MAINNISKRWMAGYLMSVCSNPIMVDDEKEPVAWLYNGVELPKLPEWDNTVYARALILEYLPDSYGYKDGLRHSLYLYSSLGGWKNSEQLWINAPYVSYRISVDDDSWQYYNSSISNTGMMVRNPGGTEIIWSNTKIPDEVGAVFLAASEPVPVYKNEGGI